MLQKPSELVLFCSAAQGGLGLQHVKCKAMANLVSVFLQTAANPRYISSQFHTPLYKYHMLGEQEGVPSPGFTPFYNKEFFNVIKKVDAPDPFSLPTVAIIALGIEQIWTNRLKSTVTSLTGMRAELNCKIALQIKLDQGRLCQTRNFLFGTI